MLFKKCGTGSTRHSTHLTETLRFSTFQILFVLSWAAGAVHGFMQMFWYGCVCVCTPLALWGKVSLGMNSLSQQDYARDRLSWSSCALNFNNPPNSEAQHQRAPSCTGQWIKTSWSPPETWQGWADIHGKLCQHSAWAGSMTFKAWQVLLQEPYELLPCNQTLHIHGARFRQFQQGAALLPPPLWPIRRIRAHGAMAWCLLPLSVCLMEGGWAGTGAVPGQPWEEAEERVSWPELLAKRVYLLLTTGTAELHNCSLPRVQGATSRQGQESFCDYFCSCRARFPPCSLKGFSHFSDCFPIRFF